MKQFRITNIVANADLGFKLNIGKLCEQRHIFKNDNFPGVVYKTLPFVKSVLLFASGRVVFTGARSMDSIDSAFIELKRRM
jgi:transcription initiation factor TFIID TATA-box-binding protein